MQTFLIFFLDDPVNCQKSTVSDSATPPISEKCEYACIGSQYVSARESLSYLKSELERFLIILLLFCNRTFEYKSLVLLSFSNLMIRTLLIS